MVTCPCEGDLVYYMLISVNVVRYSFVLYHLLWLEFVN